ncbi:MAG: hypothetical protein OIN66_08950 [Candidatus Methanoperedens sp.]|nr:hypothetical protein [Candidatus Methanoperedens sp.]
MKNLKIAGIISSILFGTFLLVYYFLVRAALVSSQDAVPKRDIYELLVYSAKPWDFFLPPIYHPVFGGYVQKFVLSHLYGSNPIEQVLYTGYIPLVLSVYAAFKYLKNKKTDEYPVVVIFILLGLLALGFMLPAYLPIDGIKVPFSLSYLLYQVTQSFRVMARFDVIIMVSASILSGISIKYLLQEKVQKWKLLFIVSTILIILFEFAPVPSNISQVKRPEQVFPFDQHEYEYHTTEIKIPDEYLWLASQKGDFTVIEYPLIIPPGKEEIIHYRYLFYQRVHKKKLINGGMAGVMRSFAGINQTSPAGKLKAMDVRYAIVHTDLVGRNINTSGFNLVKEFNNTLILEPIG